MGFSVVFFLGHFQTNCFYFIFYQFYCLAGMNHGAEYFFLSAYHLSEVSLIDIVVWIISISILKQDCLCSRFHQILISEKANSLGIKKYDLVLRSGHGNRVCSRHVVKLSFYHTAAAAVEGLAGNLFSVCKKMSLLDITHGHAKRFDPRRNA